MYRTEIIQRVVDKIGAQTYLEIGVCSGKNFRDIRCGIKIGVDPIPPNDNNVKPILSDSVMYKQMTSDEFFNSQTDLLNAFKIDVCFIDGMHTAEQALKDFNNVKKHMSRRGVVIFHDCLPENEAMQRVPQIQKRWTGDVWKAFYSIFDYYAASAPEAVIAPFIVNDDYGLGIVFKSAMVKKAIPLYSGLTWTNFHTAYCFIEKVTPEEFVSILETI